MRRSKRLLTLVRRPARWFVPSDSDVLAELRRQMSVTVEGSVSFAAWCAGDTGAADDVRAAEHTADEAKRAVRVALRNAFITPVSPEDIFSLSELLDRVINQAKDVVGESEVMDMPPDAAMAEMAGHIHEGVEQLALAVGAIAVHGGPDHGRRATAAADAATKATRHTEKVYRRAMSDLLRLERADEMQPQDVREIIGRRELYRRMSRIGVAVSEVADRVWYASVKET